MIDEKENVQSVQEEEKIKRKRNICILCMLAALILLSVLCFRGGSTGTNPIEDVTNKFNVGIDQNATEGGLETKTKEEIQAELNKKVAESMINISMNTSPEFEDGKSEGSLNIVNSTVNNYPQVVEIFLQEEVTDNEGNKKYVDGEKIYQSGLIPVGSKVTHAKLNKELSKGTYQCIAYFNAVTDEGEYIGKAAARIKINVLN